MFCTEYDAILNRNSWMSEMIERDLRGKIMHNMQSSSN